MKKILQGFGQRFSLSRLLSQRPNLHNLTKGPLPYIFILEAVFFIVLCINFPFDSWLTGWDNLHPEFSPFMNIERALSVWQTNEGVGLIGGHGYAATLLHSLLIWILSIVIPEQALRAVFTFLMLFLGTLGCFNLIRQLLKDSAEYIRNTSALFGSLFYMLGIGTIQNFYIQLEAFIVHYAALPWLFLTLIYFLDHTNKKNYLLFTLVTFLSAPMGFIPQLFIFYFLFLLVYLAVYVFQQRSKRRLLTSIVVVVTTITANAYWLFPVVYYTISNSSVYLSSYQNQQTTESFILKNKKYGDLANVPLVKGFYLDAIDSLQPGKIYYIFEPWREHFSSPVVQIVGYSLFLIAVMGLVYWCIYKRRDHTVTLGILFLLCFTVLATDTPLFSTLSDRLGSIPLFHQAFRAAFSKFSLSMALFTSVFFAIGVQYILRRISLFSSFQTKKISNGFVIAFVSLALLILSLPVFGGELFYNRTKTVIPHVYEELFSFFATQPVNGRIANFPQDWPWGWSVYRWGYSGSGFLWYGIKQPMLDRAFDVWSHYNENYYWESMSALYANDYGRFDQVVDKYNISWILFDQNATPYSNSQTAIIMDRMYEYLEKSPKYQMVQRFHSTDSQVKDIIVYKVVSSDTLPVTFYTNIPNTLPIRQFTNNDQKYFDTKGYISSITKPVDIYYPYDPLFMDFHENPTLRIFPVDVSHLRIQTELQSDLKKYEVHTIPVKETEKDLNPTLLRGDNVIEAEWEIPSEYTYQSELDPYFTLKKAVQCQGLDEGIISQSPTQEGDLLGTRFVSQGTSSCLDIPLPAIYQRYGYAVRLVYRNWSGQGLVFSIYNDDVKRNDLQTILKKEDGVNTEYFIVPPMSSFRTGYTLHFENVSYGREEAKNDLLAVDVFPLPYEYLKSISLTRPDFSMDTQKINISSSYPYGFGFGYLSTIPAQTEDGMFSLSQGFDKGWKAYVVPNDSWINKYAPFIWGHELTDHTLVNNWANGWSIQSKACKLDVGSCIIAVVYFPQYIQYIGFSLLLGLVGCSIYLWRRS